MSMSVLDLSDSLMRQYSAFGLRAPDANQVADNIMKQRDTNADSVLSGREISNLPAIFEGTDTNGDGLINIDELISKINAILGETGLSSDTGQITNIGQLKYMVAKMSLDVLLPGSQNGKSGYDFDSLLIDNFNLSGSEANTLIETMKGNPLDLFA